MSTRLRDILLGVMALLMVYVVFFKKDSNQVVATTPTRKLKNQIVLLKGNAQDRTQRIETLRNTITTYETKRDTVNIVRYQDSLILVQDTQIVKLTEITKIQDTVIMQLESDRKRLKRQRNIAVGASVILGTIAVMK